MNFDRVINRIGTHSAKWDLIQSLYGIDPTTGTSMWIADMDFEPPSAVIEALDTIKNQGIYGYYGDDSGYRNAITGWMERRHNWTIDPSHIFTTHGLVNGTALCIQAFSKPGDGIVLFTPVYHAFNRIIKAADRKVIECPLAINNGRYEMDFSAYDEMLDGRETMMILCSPHNPGGRVWSIRELKEAAEFAKRHNLILISDEIHHDLTFNTKHTAMALAAPELSDRLITMTASSKTFNIAGAHTGNIIITNQDLHIRFDKIIKATGTSPNSFGLYMTEAAYKHGDAWVDALCEYLDGNRKIIDDTIARIPGLISMPLEATYLSWVDFSGTGMEKKEYINRVQKHAKIAANHGETFGKGGENYLRFNFALPRSMLIKTMKRLETAFQDLQ